MKFRTKFHIVAGFVLIACSLFMRPVWYGMTMAFFNAMWALCSEEEEEEEAE